MGETPIEAAIREVREETAICLSQEQLTFIHTAYCWYPDIAYVLHLFYSRLERQPEVLLDAKEHTDYAWKTLAQARRDLPMMRGGEECIACLLNWLNKIRTF